jgi:hypothetical protein
MPAHPPEGEAAREATVTVVEVVVFAALPPGACGSRRAIVRWSDGAVGEALRWYDDEVLVCEGDLVGKTAAGIRALHFRRDRDYLRAPDSRGD